MIVLVYFDGAVEPVNPGGLGTYGFVIRDLLGRGEVPVMGCGTLGDGPGMTNNVAEYNALGKALRWLADNVRADLGPADQILITGDSKLVIEQLNGNWQCKSDGLRPLLRRCKELLAGFGCTWAATWVKREHNTLADALAQAAYVGATGKAFPVREKGPTTTNGG